MTHTYTDAVSTVATFTAKSRSVSIPLFRATIKAWNRSDGILRERLARAGETINRLNAQLKQLTQPPT